MQFRKAILGRMTRRAALDLGDYLPYLINRVGSALVVDFSAAALARHRLSIGMWRVLAVLASEGRQRQIFAMPPWRSMGLRSSTSSPDVVPAT